ncbi:hypothetical protein [Streptomyces sp. adm13(2018)]|uniref:hypothetical protein n=1 Tax=Streptomyces sp. adm13(2018) TaxID=2479007 RepID=UPI0011CD5A07|nr:hypothetical protein [Streptomyces sp. adm13(2018)]
MSVTAAELLRARLGRRGSVLLGFGVLELLYGLGLVLDPRFGIVRGVGVLTHVAPMAVWGGLWMACGLCALAMAWEVRATRDTWGYAAAILPPIGWAGANLIAWLTGSFAQAWTSAVTWGCLAYVIRRVNGWPEVRGDREGRP